MSVKGGRIYGGRRGFDFKTNLHSIPRLIKVCTPDLQNKKFIIYIRFLKTLCKAGEMTETSAGYFI